jgi:hypothetical protein
MTTMTEGPAVMTTDVDIAWLVESSVIDARPHEPVTADRLLRRLDVLRQRLAVRWCGTAGAFAGFDHLQMTNQVAVPPGTVHLEARMVEARDKSHIVEYSAILTYKDAADEAMRTVIATGRGRTLQVTGA